MKTLLIFFGLLLGVLPETYAQQCVNTTGIKHEIALAVVDDDDEWDGKSNINNNGEEPSLMSLFSQQPYAYLYSNNVGVVFEGSFQSVEICIVDNEADETVYRETYAYPGEVLIPLNRKGDYTLRIVADGTTWEGWFIR